MLGWIFFRALRRMPKPGVNHLHSSDDVQRSDACVLKCVVTCAGVGMPRSTTLWRNPKRIAWRASSSVRHANTYTWWDALVIHSDQLNANFMQMLPHICDNCSGLLILNRIDENIWGFQPYNIKMKHSGVTENDLRGNCWCPIVREHVALVTSLLFLLHWESKVCCKNSYVTVSVSANMVAISPFWHNDAAVVLLWW